MWAFGMGSDVFTTIVVINGQHDQDTAMFFRIKKKREPLCGLYSEGEFKALIDHERRRSDRTNESFSVAVFDVGDIKTDMDKVCRIPDELVDTARSTDEVGWFDKKRIGLLLPDTNAKGAKHVAKYFSSTVHPSFGSLVPTIYTYPSYYLESDDNSSRDNEISNFSPVADLSRDGGTPLQKETHDDGVTLSHKPGIPSNGKMSGSPPLGLEPYLGVAIPDWKRIFDIICSSIGLMVLSPLFLLIAIMIKIVSPGPVFFIQERVGYLGRHFGLKKFRTMKAETDTAVHEDHVRELIKSGGSMRKLDDDPRIIPFGKILRKSGADELPQLINVLCGQMTLVGPRPCLPSEFEEYLRWHKRRFYTAPGITGLWQVSGKNRLTFKKMIRLDITYEQERSLIFDLKILLKTLPVVANIAT